MALPMRWPSVLVLALAILALALPISAGVRAAPEPLDVVPLVRLGYRDTILRGRVVSTDYFIPGPGDFLLADENSLDLDYLPSDLLSRESGMTILWNGVPLTDRTLGSAPGRKRLSVRLPKERIEPDINRLQIQALLVLAADVCGGETPPGRYVTILNTSQIRYSFVDRRPHPRPVAPDLARYPAPFILPFGPQPPPIRLVIPDQPDSTELTALLRVATQLGQFAGTRGLRLELVRDSQVDQAEPSEPHLIFVGRRSALPSLDRLPTGSLGRAAGGGYLEPMGQPVPPGVGVILEVVSPWSPARLALVVTGEDDEAVERAAMVVAGRTGTRSLRGDFGLVPQAVPASASIATGSGSVTRLSDLGRTDSTLAGAGDHTVAFSIDASGQAGRIGLFLDLVITHSPMLDRTRSFFRVVVNGVPLSATQLRDLQPTYGVKRFEIPPASLKSATNSVAVEFTLYLQETPDGERCVRVPNEQGWAVLHANSSFQPATREVSAPDAVALASYPYPFVRDGQMGETLVVVPDSLSDGTAFVQLAADLGRAARADLLLPRAVRAAEFTPALAAGRDVIVWGLPEENSVIAQLGNRLPLQVGEQQRLILGRDLTVAIRDLTRLGLLEEIGSPWSRGRMVLVVTATGREAMVLAAEALRQGSLAGNAAIASQAEPQPIGPERTPTPEPFNLAGPRPLQLQVTTYRLPVPLQPDQSSQEDTPASFFGGGPGTLMEVP